MLLCGNRHTADPGNDVGANMTSPTTGVTTGVGIEGTAPVEVSSPLPHAASSSAAHAPTATAARLGASADEKRRAGPAQRAMARRSTIRRKTPR